MKKLLFTLGIGVMLGSCTVMHSVVVTNNPVGSKRGEMKSHPFMKDQGVSFAEAMEKGNITKIGITEYKQKVIFIPIETLTVTGE